MAAAQGNRYVEKHSIEEWENIFEGIYEKAKQGEFLSLQQAFIESDVRPSTATWLCSKYKALATIKKDIGDCIISEINEKGLKGDFNVAAVIWRSKQLGEVEKQVIEQSTTTVELTHEERLEAIKRLKDKL